MKGEFTVPYRTYLELQFEKILDTKLEQWLQYFPAKLLSNRTLSVLVKIILQ
jgi:hypothetical protein